jgi:class 3 adenylate cyclase
MWQVVLNGPGYLDTAYELREGETLLGRSEENQIVLAGENVSRQHARLVLEGGSLHLEDLDSRNGVLLNGRALESVALLREGDVVEIGDNRLAFFRYDPSRLSLYERKVDDLPSMVRLRQANRVGLGDPGLDPFVLLVRASERLAKSTSLDAFLSDVAGLVLELAGGETAAGLLPGPDGQLGVRAAQHVGAPNDPPISWSIARRAYRDRTVLCVADTFSDPRFRHQQSVILQGSRQVVCLPILRDQTPLGVFYLTRQGAGDGLEGLLDALTAISYLTASGLERALIRERAEREALARKTLERFLAPDVVDRVAEEAGSLSMEERSASVLFADISGFTALTERASPERVVELLDEFYRKMTEVVFSFGGTVDKFIGDEVMAIFGAPYSYGDDASRAIRAALAMREAFRGIKERHDFMEGALKIGLHHGKVLAGTVGGEHRLAYTAVGDTVNVASRLVMEATPDQILASTVVLRASAPLQVQAVPMGERRLRGRVEPVEVCELVGAWE